jgi:hypothetical protein
MRCWWVISAVFLLVLPLPTRAQTISHRGVVEGTTFMFPLETTQDSTQFIGDLLAREEGSLRPAPWIALNGGLELRANTDDQVDDEWQPDFKDRGLQRPRLSIRRLSLTLNHGRFTLDLGKQFVRWGKTDIVVPTDRFAPRDFLSLVDAPYLAVTAVRATAQFGSHMVDAVWSPLFTPSRIPLAGQRWVPVPENLPPSVSIVAAPASFPKQSQAGIRWGQIRDRFEYSASFYDGFNSLPDIAAGELDPSAARIAFTPVYPDIRTYGADAAISLPWFTVKSEVAYFTSPSERSDEYALYVVQLERQSGEWMFLGGYVGEAVAHRRAALSFNPDRGLSRSLVGRMSYTIDSNRSLDLETAVRQDGGGIFIKGEYSQARGQHWRATLTGVLLQGKRDDFIGQYDRNSYVRLSVRFSF